ncbi:MAG TPA: hypothetical protein VMW15_04110 [Terracidiphilus sp.]|nr:hypothetical protein [Terracidiphilus sp.]
MNFQTGSPEQKHDKDADAVLHQALKNFQSSVHAWSEAEYSKPRTGTRVHYTSWRMAAGWVMGCVLAVGSVTGALYQRHHNKELAKIVAAQAATQQKIAAELQRQKENEDLLAKVDSDVSRQVPRAMQPLAQLMTSDDPQSMTGDDAQ